MLLNLYAPVHSKYDAYMVLSLHINHKAYYGRGEGGEGGTEVGGEIDYILTATLSPPE